MYRDGTTLTERVSIPLAFQDGFVRTISRFPERVRTRAASLLRGGDVVNVGDVEGGVEACYLALRCLRAHHRLSL